MGGDAALAFVVGPDEAGRRLDRACALHVGSLSRSQVQKLNAQGGVTVDGRRRPDSYALRAGETVHIEAALLAPPGRDEAGAPVAQDIPVPVVYEDDDVVVVDKPAGLVVHPAHGNWDGTLVNALLGRGTRLAALGSPERPGVVHRLDKDTSGVMVLAKTDAAYRSLTAQLKAHRVGKVYHGIARGNLATRELVVDAPVGRHPARRQEMAVVEGRGKAARTELFVVDRFTHFDYIRVTIFTGRTHQIRVHLSHVGHPLLGDAVYGGRRRRATGAVSHGLVERLLKILPRHALHASMLDFEHPRSGERVRFQSALPDDMRMALETIYREDRTKEVLD